MKACIKALTANGYYINDFSPVRLQVLHEDNPDVTAISERIAEDNQNDMCMCVYSSIHGYHILFGATAYRFRIMNRHTLRIASMAF